MQGLALDVPGDLGLEPVHARQQGLDGGSHRVRFRGIRRIGSRLPALLRAITWPGTPTTTDPSGTDRSTTAFAPIRLSVPTVTGPRILAPAPTTTRSPTVGCRFPWSVLIAAERDPVVERHVVAHLGRLPDDHAGAVVDEQAAPDAARRGGSRRPWPTGPAGTGPGRQVPPRAATAGGSAGVPTRRARPSSRGRPPSRLRAAGSRASTESSSARKPSNVTSRLARVVSRPGGRTAAVLRYRSPNDGMIDDDELPGVLRAPGDLAGGPQRGARGDADEQALLDRRAARQRHRVLVLHLDDLVVDGRVEDLGYEARHRCPGWGAGPSRRRTAPARRPARPPPSAPTACAP